MDGVYKVYRVRVLGLGFIRKGYIGFRGHEVEGIRLGVESSFRL